MKRLFLVLSVLAFAGAAGAATLDSSIESAAREISGKLPRGARIAIVSFKSDSEKVSDYIMEELTYAFMGKGLEVADRTNLPYIRKELQLQAQAAEGVSDRDGQRIGKFLGAEAVITGDFVPLGDSYRLGITATAVESAERLAMARTNVSNSREIQTLVAAIQNNTLVSRPYQPQQKQKTAGNYLDEGIKLFSQNRFNEAIEALTRSIQIDSQFAAAYFNRGKAYEFAGVPNRALADYTQAIKLKPNDADAYNGRGIAYILKGDYYSAIADYSKAIEILINLYSDNSPVTYTIDLGTAYKNRGVAYQFAVDPDRAIEDFNKAIRINPIDPDAYYDRALAYESKGDYTRAITDLTKAVNLDPDNKNFKEILERAKRRGR